MLVENSVEDGNRWSTVSYSIFSCCSVNGLRESNCGHPRRTNAYSHSSNDTEFVNEIEGFIKHKHAIELLDKVKEVQKQVNGESCESAFHDVTNRHFPGNKRGTQVFLNAGKQAQYYYMLKSDYKEITTYFSPLLTVKVE